VSSSSTSAKRRRHTIRSAGGRGMSITEFVMVNIAAVPAISFL